jgi:uncharacterized protein (DUF486 family)
MPFLSAYLTPILLLTGSNVFMTAAWYWHLRYKEVPLFKVILISWGLALIEYCLAVPANRYGNAVYNAAQLSRRARFSCFTNGERSLRRRDAQNTSGRIVGE